MPSVMLLHLMTLKKLFTIGSVLGALCVASLVIYAYAHRSDPILLRVEEPGNPIRTPSILVLNPFRDRGAENSANAFLERLKQGQCAGSVQSLYNDSPEYRQYICERELRSPLQSWSLGDLQEQSAKIRIYFWNERPGYGSQKGQLWVTVAMHGDQWQVVNYESWY